MDTITYKSKLHETVATTDTDYWNDSCSLEELTYAIENGATGATTNPTIVGEVLKKEMPLWRERIKAIMPGTQPGARTSCLEADRRDGGQGRGAALAGLPARGRQKRPPLDPDQPQNYRNAEA